MTEPIENDIILTMQDREKFPERNDKIYRDVLGRSHPTGMDALEADRALLSNGYPDSLGIMHATKAEARAADEALMPKSIKNIEFPERRTIIIDGEEWISPRQKDTYSLVRYARILSELKGVGKERPRDLKESSPDPKWDKLPPKK